MTTRAFYVQMDGRVYRGNWREWEFEIGGLVHPPPYSDGLEIRRGTGHKIHLGPRIARTRS